MVIASLPVQFIFPNLFSNKEKCLFCYGDAHNAVFTQNCCSFIPSRSVPSIKWAFFDWSEWLFLSRDRLEALLTLSSFETNSRPFNFFLIFVIDVQQNNDNGKAFSFRRLLKFGGRVWKNVTFALVENNFLCGLQEGRGKGENVKKKRGNREEYDWYYSFQ